MEITLKSFVLFTSLVLTGLSAGLFYAWSVSVIPGTQKVIDSTYLEAMQAINRAILNPAFFLVFFGSLVALGLASIYEFHTSKVTFGLLLTASMLYMVGTIGITAVGNIPLNDQLDALNLKEMTVNQLAEFRQSYERDWNRWHLIRTFFSVASFLLVVLAIFTGTKN